VDNGSDWQDDMELTVLYASDNVAFGVAVESRDKGGFYLILEPDGNTAMTLCGTN